MKKQLFISAAILLFIVSATIGVILYGKGYRFGFDNGKANVLQTGLLVATSTPDGAQVYINDHLTTATDNTINLSPGIYDIKITKEGYFNWEKKINVQQGIVSKAEAVLFPTYPKLDNLTSTGVLKPVADPSLTKIAYIVASQSADPVRKNGVYVLDMNGGSLLSLQNSSRQIADDTADTFSQSNLAWSPDGQSLLASISANRSNSSVYLLDATKLNQSPKDVTETLQSLESQWTKDKEAKEKALFSTLQSKLLNMVQANFSILAWSPDETKILYTASQSALLPTIINPPLIGTNSTPENRAISNGNTYVYDIKEDKNYFIADVSKHIGTDHTLQWMPDGKHLLVVENSRIEIMEYDGTNLTTIYAGPFYDHYVFPWIDGSKIVILTDLNNPDILPNLYSVSLK